MDAVKIVRHIFFCLKSMFRFPIFCYVQVRRWLQSYEDEADTRHNWTDALLGRSSTSRFGCITWKLGWFVISLWWCFEGEEFQEDPETDTTCLPHVSDKEYRLVRFVRRVVRNLLSKPNTYILSFFGTLDIFLP